MISRKYMDSSPENTGSIKSEISANSIKSC